MPRMRIWPIALLFVSAVFCQPMLEGSTPTYGIYRLPGAPKLDGEVSADPAWKAVPGVTGFYILGGDFAIEKQTTAKAGWTPDALYIAVICEEPDIALIKSRMKDGDDLWTEDSIEIFLQLPDRNGIFQLVVNTAGAKTLGTGNLILDSWKAATKKGKDTWSVEIEIPFASLRTKVAGGTVWHGAFCRNIWQYKSGGAKFNCWPALRKRFHEPEHFAAWKFEDRTLSPERAAAEELWFCRDYRNYLRKQVKELKHSARAYREALERAAAVPKFRDEAEALLKLWQTVGDLVRAGRSAPIGRLREIAGQAEDLQTRSYELKYRYLIDGLFEEKQ